MTDNVTPSRQPKRILILTADAGFGHRSAANAVEKALKLLYGDDVEVNIVNPLDDEKAPSFLRDSQSDYDKWVKDVPDLYQFGYNASDAFVPTQIMESYLAFVLRDVMRDLMKQYKPDVVLTTYPMYQAAVTALFRNKKYHVPFYTVITDLATVHRLWFHPRVDGLLVPNQIVANLATSYQVKPAKIKITGIPVSPDIAAETRSKAEVREELGWQPDLPTVLAVGSKRMQRLVDALHVLNHYGTPIQVVVVTGNDQELFDELNHLTWHVPVKLYGFVENLAEFMKAADLLMCKAGGLIVTEALASGLPMILIEAIPGQETGNAEYVTSNGAGDMAQSTLEILEVVHHLVKDNQVLLKNRAANACRMGMDQSALDVAKILWKAANEGVPHRQRSLPGTLSTILTK